MFCMASEKILKHSLRWCLVVTDGSNRIALPVLFVALVFPSFLWWISVRSSLLSFMYGSNLGGKLPTIPYVMAVQLWGFLHPLLKLQQQHLQGQSGHGL